MVCVCHLGCDDVCLELWKVRCVGHVEKAGRV